MKQKILPFSVALSIVVYSILSFQMSNARMDVQSSPSYRIPCTISREGNWKTVMTKKGYQNNTQLLENINTVGKYGHGGSVIAIDLNSNPANTGARSYGICDDLNIYSARAGTVLYNGWYANGGGGWMVQIQHSDGQISTYAHMERQSTLVLGDLYPEGTLIGRMGDTGIAEGIHLHFSIDFPRYTQTDNWLFKSPFNRLHQSDFNGDSKDDTGVFTPNGWIVNLSTGSGWTGATWTGGGGTWGEIPLVGDFNGDGKDDTGVFTPNGWIVNLSTGSGWVGATWTGGGGTWGEIPLVGDFNGDGKDDTGVFTPNGWIVNLSTGSGWVGATWTGGGGTWGEIPLNAPLFLRAELAYALQQPPLQAPGDGSIGTSIPTFQWGRVQGASRYHIQIASSPDFSSPIHETMVAGGTSYSPSSLAPGTYVWRVRSLNRFNSPGAWSVARQITLNPTTGPLPMGYIDTPPGTRVGHVGVWGWAQVENSTIDRIEVWVDGQYHSQATYGVPRPDLGGNYGYEWLWDTATAPNGEHTTERVNTFETDDD